MQMKDRLKNVKFFVFVYLIVSIAACRSLLPGSETPTVLPGVSSLKPMILMEGQPPSFIESKGSLPNKPGSYLIYSEQFSEQAGQVKYISTDGTVTGDLLRYSNIDNWFPAPFMSSGQSVPRFIFTDYHQGEIMLRNGELNVWITDPFGELVHSWHLSTEPGMAALSSAGCGGPSFSPSGRWMTLICLIPGQYYIDLVDLTSGEQKIIPVPDVAATVPTENWSQDETRFYTWSHSNIYCFVSLLSDEAICRDVGKPVLSVSPDWQSAVMFDGDMSHNPDGTVPGTRILVAVMECVLDGLHCENSLSFELPFNQSAAGDSHLSPAIQLRWNALGSKLAWMNGGYIDQTSQEAVYPPACGWITLPEKTNQRLCEQAPSRASLLDISLDENWLLVSDSRDLYLLSTRKPSIQHLITPTSEFGAISFYGWLTVQ
jgi:hypothetical protein